MNELDKNQKNHHNEHYSEILKGGINRYDGFINSESIWYWMHTYCLEYINEFFEKIPKSYFLTVGDGYCGRESSFVKKFGHKVHTSDIETCLIKLAYEKGLVDEYSEQDMNNLSFEDDFFDYSLVKESLHHLSKPYQGLYELLRVSKNGIILVEPNGDLDIDYNVREFEGCGNYSFAFTSNELIKIGLSYGYKNFAVTYSNMFYGQHNIENISKGDLEIEKNRLINIDKNLNPMNKPLMIFLFLKDRNILNSLSDKFKKIMI